MYHLPSPVYVNCEMCMLWYLSEEFCILTWFALVQVAAFSRFARAFGYEDVEIARLAYFSQTPRRTAHTATGQRAAFARWSVTFNQH